MAEFTPPQLFGRSLILVGDMAYADGSFTENMGYSSRTCINDASIYLYKHTDDGKTHPGFKTLIHPLPKTGIHIEVFAQKENILDLHKYSFQRNYI